MGKSSDNLTRMAIKSLCIEDTEATENGENKNPIQQMQTQSYDAVKQCGKLGHYGYYGNAPRGSLVVIMQANGQEECLFGAEDDVNNRPRGLAEGEVMMYNTITKNAIYMKEDGNTEIYTQNDLVANITNHSIIHIHGNSTVKVEGNSNVDVKGNSQVNIEGNNKIQVKGDSDIGIHGNAKVDIKGNAEVKTDKADVKSSDITIDCDNLDIKATKTTINSEVEIIGETSITGDTSITGNTGINGNTTITGNCDVGGTLSGATVEAGNGSSGTYTTSVSASNGIVTGGS